MKKRTLIMGDYDTAAARWTLAALHVTKAPQVQNFLSVPGRFAPIDLSTYLTDGEPYYESAQLSATLENSTGTHDHREKIIQDLVDRIDGHTLQIIHPDKPDRYMVGRIQVQPEFNNQAYCVVTISAVCEAWSYAKEETTVELIGTDVEQTTQLVNNGRLSVTPAVTVTGEIDLVFGQSSISLSAGTYLLPEIYLKPGAHDITYKGAGTATLTYREAVLAV